MELLPGTFTHLGCLIVALLGILFSLLAALESGLAWPEDGVETFELSNCGANRIFPACKTSFPPGPILVFFFC